MRKSCVLLFLLLSSVQLFFSMPGSDHAISIKNYLNFAGSQEYLQKSIEEFSKFFDYEQILPKEAWEIIKNNSDPALNKNHRLFGHWGFSEKVPFAELNETTGYFYNFNSNEKKIVQAAWTEIRQNMISSVTKNFGLEGKKATAFAGVLYDLHIYGDYSGTVNTPLQNPRKLYDDIFKHLYDLTDNDKDAKLLIERLKKMENPLSAVDDFNQLTEIVYEKNKVALNSKNITGANLKTQVSNPLQEILDYKTGLKLQYGEFQSEFNKMGVSQEDYLNNPSKYNDSIKKWKNTYAYKMKQNFKLSAQAALLAFGFEMFNSLVLEGDEFDEALYDSAMKGGVAGGATFVAEGLITSIGDGKFALTTLINEPSILKRAVGTGVNYGLITFIMDETMSVYSWAVEGRSGEELLEDTIKNSLIAGSSFLTTSVMVLCGFAPGGIVVMAVAFGTEFLVSKAVDKVYEYHTFKNYLMEDDYVGFLPTEFVNTETPWNQPENETPWNQPENETPWNQPENESPWNQPQNETPWNTSGFFWRRLELILDANKKFS